MREHRIKVNGVELFYAEEGDGSPCLLLHGGPGWKNLNAIFRLYEIF